MTLTAKEFQEATEAAFRNGLKEGIRVVADAPNVAAAEAKKMASETEGDLKLVSEAVAHVLTESADGLRGVACKV